MAEPQPSLPIATMWRLAANTPGLKKVMVLAALASLAEGFGIVLLVPVLAAMAQSPAGSGWAASILPALPLPLLLAAILLLVSIRLALRHALTVEQTTLQYSVVDRLRRDIYSGLHLAEWRWLSQQRQSDHVSVVVTETGRIGQGVKDIVQTAGLTFSAAIYAVAAFLLSWQTALVAAGAGGLLLLIAKPERDSALALGHSLGLLNRQVHRTAQEGIQTIRMSKILGLEATESAALADAVGNLRAAQQQHLRDSGRSGALGHMAMALLITGSILFGIEVADIGVATLLPMLLVVVRIVPALEGIQRGWQHWLEVAPAVEAAEKFIATLAQVAEPVAADAPPARLTREITLDRIALRFDGRATPALTGIDLSIPAFCTTAITGPSGAGKSTLADVLMGLIVPDTGAVLIDGVPLSSNNRQQWRQSVAYVEQDATMRNGTIRRNLANARPDATEADINAALEAASAGFVHALPDGIDTEIGDNGVLLSGGERQRIALARALLRAPQLLILDEATNALDPENEAAIRAALKTLHGRMTIVIISHGSAMIDDVDRIVRLEDGRVVSVRPGAGGGQLRAVPG